MSLIVYFIKNKIVANNNCRKKEKYIEIKDESDKTETEDVFEDEHNDEEELCKNNNEPVSIEEEKKWKKKKNVLRMKN